MVFNSTLTGAVENFAALMLPLSEKDLEQSWKWKDHDEEGIRFAFFVTLQELRDLAVKLAALPPKPTPARHILSQYHAAYMDLQAALLGLSAEDAARAPVEGEWSIKQAYSHILRTDIGFTVVVRYALESHRFNRWTPDPISDESFDRLSGISDGEYTNLTEGSFDGMLAYHRGFHSAMIEEFSRITDDELDLPSTFWEDTRFPIRHRLQRYEAHFAQHTVQIDKALVAIGQAPGESKRLLRKVYAALAEAEGFMFGNDSIDDTAVLPAAASIAERTQEIKTLMSSR